MFSDLRLERNLIKSILTEKRLKDWNKIKSKDFIYSDENYKELHGMIKDFHYQYESLPRESSLIDFIKKNKRADLLESLSECIEESGSYDVSFLYKELKHIYINRKIAEEEENIKDQLGNEDGVSLLKKRINSSLQILTETEDEKITRRELWESAKERWQDYNAIEEKGLGLRGPSFKIKMLDKVLGGCSGEGGMCVLVYGLPGSGKSTLTAVNLPTNLSIRQNYSSAIAAREMPEKKLGTLFDARLTMLDSSLLRDACLSERQKKKFRLVIEKQIQRKNNVYIIDVPSGAFTPTFLRTELEIYKDKFGHYPHYFGVDSLYLMESENEKINETDSRKYKYCSKSMFEMSRELEICTFLTHQESRTGAVFKRQKITRGQEAVKDSHGIMPNVTDAFLIDVPEGEEYIGRVQLTTTKARYGPLVNESLFYLKEYSYIGDEDYE